MADEIQADYDQLEEVANRFANQGQAIEEMLQKVQASMGKLEDDGWIGLGSDAFFGEMHDEVLPATNRLLEALNDASEVTKMISRIIKNAEEEAAAPFRNA